MTKLHDIFIDIQSYIEANFDKPITLSDFARMRGISQRDVQTALSYQAKSWTRMLFDQRMKRARELLSYSSESIEVIAERCGFGDAAQFSRSFKINEGKEPEEYRQWKQNPRTTSLQNGSASS